MRTDQRMQIDIAEIRESGKPLLVDREFGDEELAVGSDVVQIRNPAKTRLEVSVAGDRVRVSGELNAELELVCCRCLKTFPDRVNKSFDLSYLPDPQLESEHEEFELRYEDLEIGFYRSDQLDLSAVISEQVVLDVPMKPVCQPQCKGLCDQCGADLNEGACNCVRETVDPRLAVLESFKKRLD